jgi:hypothetical protein
VKRFNGSPTQIIATDGAYRVHIDSIAGELSDTAREVRRCPTKARPVWKHVPQYFADTNDRCARHHREISSFPVMAQEKH